MARSVSNSANRSGFTLVEMLVAVAIVLLMMTMFASIFTMATGAISTQRGMANNDQKARSITTVIRADLDKRTFRNVIPFFPFEDATTSPNPFGDRQGYFYLSVNNLDDEGDNVLQFTVNARIIRENEDETPYYGRGTQLLGAALVDLDGDGDVDLDDARIDLVNNPNQPEADDGRVEPNVTAQSTAAEVCYVLRGGKLYRREILIREPLELAGEETKPQPELADGSDLFDLNDDVSNPLYVPLGGTGNFHADFDFAAIRTFDGVTFAPSSVARFLGVESLNNEAAGSTFFSLGKPAYRWGHNTYPGNGLFGQPREYTVAPGCAVAPEFFGRFLHEETSNLLFQYPQGSMLQAGGGAAYGVAGHPMDMVDTPLVDAGAAGNFSLDPERQVVSALANGSRRSEELLLAGVHEFRVEVWDDRLGRFVKPGHTESLSGVRGDYHIGRRWNSAYGPMAASAVGVGGGALANRVIDTWHPGTGVIGAANTPPFRAMTYYPPRASGDSVIGPAPSSWPASDTPIPFVSHMGSSQPANHPYWQPGHNYGVGSVVFPLTEDTNQNNMIDPGEDGALNGTDNNGVLDNDLNEPSRPFGFSFHYLCIQAGQTGTDPPNWQARDGAKISEDSLPGPNGNGVAGEAGEAIWLAVPNLRPVRAIRITIRFLDQGTETMRQVSLTHSLMN